MLKSGHQSHFPVFDHPRCQPAKLVFWDLFPAWNCNLPWALPQPSSWMAPWGSSWWISNSANATWPSPHRYGPGQQRCFSVRKWGWSYCRWCKMMRCEATSVYTQHMISDIWYDIRNYDTCGLYFAYTFMNIHIIYSIVLVCCLNCWRAAWTHQQPSTMLRPMDRCCWMKQKFCRSLAWFMIVGVSSWLFWHILTGCCSYVYRFVYCTSPLSYVVVAIWFYRFFWIPHTSSIASWWYQRVSYGIMIHSLTPGSVGQESTGDGFGSRFVAAHAQGWGGGCVFMDVTLTSVLQTYIQRNLLLIPIEGNTPSVDNMDG